MTGRFLFRDERGMRLSITRHQHRKPRMTRDDIAHEVRTVTAKRLRADPRAMAPETTLAELGADSISHIEVVMDLEDAFKIDVTDDEAEHLKTVGQLVDLVSAKLSVTA